MYEHSGFILRLVIEGNQIKFEPDFKDFEVQPVIINLTCVSLEKFL